MTAADSSTYGFSGRLVGKTSWNAGKTGGGLRFDGSQGYLDIGGVNPFRGQFTIAAWVKFDAVNKGNDNALLGNGSAVKNGGLHVGERNGKTWFSLYSNDLTGSRTLDAGAWTHLVFVHTGTQKQVYVNGVLDATQTSVLCESDSSNTRLGAYPFGSSSHQLQGVMDDFRIYERALTSTDVTALFASSTTVLVAPRTATLAVGQTQSFAGTISGNANSSLTWELPDANSGSLTQQGVYTAPATVPSGGATYRVLARSQADTSQTDTVRVTVKPYVQISPATLDLACNGTYPFQVEVTGLANTQVSWSATGGTVSGGTYTAPSTAGSYTITATSVVDGTKKGTATVRVTSGNIPANNGLLGHWAFENHAQDDSGNANHGTLTGGAAYVAGQSGRGVRFDGVNSGVDIPAVNPFTGSFSVSAWVKFDSVNKGNDNAILGHGKNATNQGLGIGERGGKAFFSFCNNDLAGSSLLQPGVWTFLVFVYDGAQKRIYVNGSLEASQNSVAYLSTLSNAQIGRYPWTGTWLKGNTSVFQGSIDEVRVYKRAISGTEISSLYTSTVNVRIDPRTPVLALGQTQTFSTLVSGHANTAVTWSVVGTESGSIASNGVYTPPSTIPYQGVTYRVKATSQAVNTQSDTVQVTIKYPVYVTPKAATVSANGRAVFAAEVTGLASTLVNWSASGGSITPEGVFTAPSTSGPVTITATSVSDGTKLDTATISVIQPDLQSDVFLPFDEGVGTTVQDPFGSGVVGTLTNSPTWVDGKIGKALNFSGSKSVATLTPAIKLGSPWTLSAWFSYPLPVTTNYHTLTAGTSSDHQIVIGKDQVSLGTFQYQGQKFWDSGFKLNTLGNGWHHVTAVGTNGTTRFYIDGQPVGNVIPWQSTSKVSTIGNFYSGNMPFGIVDEFKAFNKVLTGTEIATLAAGVRVQVSPNQVALGPNGQQAFTANVNGTANQTVTWELPDPSSGAITAAGVYTAPSILPYEGVRYRVVARSAQDPSQTFTAWVTVASPISASLPLMHLPFLEGSGDVIKDVSGHGFRANFIGTPAWESSGKVGSAIRTAANQAVQVPAFPKLTNAFSVSIWIYPTDKGTRNPEGGILVNREGEFEIARFQDGTIRYAIALTSPAWSAPWTNTGFVAPLNQWSHIVWTYSSSQGLLKTYANGVEVHSQAGSGTIGDGISGYNDDFRIGGRAYLSQYFQGRLDEVRMYDRAITPGEVSALYALNAVEVYPAEAGVRPGQASRFTAAVPNVANQGVTWELPVASSGNLAADGTYTAPSSVHGGDATFPVIARSVADTSRTGSATIRARSFANTDPALMGYWRFDENAGQLVLDQSRFANHGLIEGNPLPRTSGRIGNAVAFDGANGEIVVPDHPALNPQSLTLSLWLRLDRDPACDPTADNWRCILYKGFYKVATETGYDLILGKDRKVWFDTGTGTTDRWNPKNALIPIGQWTHVVFTYDANTGLKSVFQDGVLMDTKRVAALPLAPGAYDLHINNPANYCPTSGYGAFPGAMDEFRIYNRALSAAEVSALFAEVVSVIIQPRDAVVAAGQTQSFRAIVGGTANSAVSWSLPDSGSGAIDTNGNYTAPIAIPSHGVQYRVQAQSQAQASATDFVFVTVKEPVHVEPMVVSVPVNGKVAFSAEVTGLANSEVTWSASAGSISATGVFTAPSVSGTVTITATSAVDTTKSGTASVTITSASGAVDAWFPLDEGGGTTTGDASGHGVVGTLLNGTSWIEGRFGQGLYANTGKQAVMLNPSVALGDAWTITAWFKYPLPTTSEYHSLVRGALLDHQIIIHSDQSRLGLWDSPSSTFRASGYSFANLTAGWHQVAAVGIQGTTSYYIDGQPVGTPVSYQSRSDVAYIGGNPEGTNGQPFGSFDEVKIFRRALGHAEIAGLFAAGVNVTIAPAQSTLATGQSQAFSATVSNASNTAVTWELPVSGSGSVTNGLYTAPASIPYDGHQVRLYARSVQEPTCLASVLITLRNSVVVSPASVTLGLGGTQAFTAALTGLTGAVTWSATGGTFSGGTYTAPQQAGFYTITATSAVDTTKKGTALVYVMPRVSIQPAQTILPAGYSLGYVAQVFGTSDQRVLWSVLEAGGGSISETGIYTPPNVQGTYTVRAASKLATGAYALGQVTVPLMMAIDPDYRELRPGASATFRANISGLADQRVTWSLQEGAAGGDIDVTGNYTAPAAVGTYHVIATSVANTSLKATATIEVATGNPIFVSIAPAGVELDKGGSTTFTATVDGTSNKSVTWSVLGTNAGTINANGDYVAPNVFGTFTIKAASVVDPSAYDLATLVVRAQSGQDKTFTYDENGNMTSDGERTFEWDAENRLVSVTIVATGHRSEFGYDGLGRRVAITEKDPDANQVLQVTSDKKYLWDGVEIAEERDATGGTVLKRFFAQGFVDTDGTALYYTRDHLGSIRELTDSSQTVRARYDYDPYGRMTKVSGDRDSFFGYTGHQWHAQSGLNLAMYRAYDPNLGRWINRDPMESLALQDALYKANGMVQRNFQKWSIIPELHDGLNLYAYVKNDPAKLIDKLGLECTPPHLTWWKENYREFLDQDWMTLAPVGVNGVIGCTLYQKTRWADYDAFTRLTQTCWDCHGNETEYERTWSSHITKPIGHRFKLTCNWPGSKDHEWEGG